MSLLDSVKGVMTNAVVDKAADVLGIESGMAKSALKLFLPAIIGGVINKGATSSGAGGLLDLFKKGGFGDDNLGDLAGVLGSPEKKNGWLETGTDLLGTIFGNQQSGLLDMLLKATGISKSGGSSLLSFLAPIVINKLAGMVFSKNMNASQLSSYLGDQKNEVMGLVPGLNGLLAGNVSEAVGATTASNSGGGMGFMKYLLPILLGAGLLWFLTKDGCGKKAEVSSATTTEVTSKHADKPAAKVNAHEGHNHDGHNHDGHSHEATKTTTAKVENTTNVDMSAFKAYKLNANGDIVSGSGAVVYSAGTFDVDGTMNLVDAKGRMLAPVSALSDDFKTQLKEGMSKIRLSKMRLMFADMIVKKEGAITSYGLSNIEFNKENHKIANFSKAEVMGLAEALKSNATGKIEVQVHTADGKNDKANNDLSETRAKVIRDMLITLGVKEGQIKAVGKGSADAAKAKLGKVDIVVN